MGTKVSSDYSGDDIADLLATPVPTTPEAPAASIESEGEKTTEYQDTAVSSKNAKNTIKKEKKRARKEATSSSVCSQLDNDSDNDKDTNAETKEDGKAKECTACGKKIKPGEPIYRQYRMHKACGPHVRKATYAAQKVWGKGKQIHKKMKQIKGG